MHLKLKPSSEPRVRPTVVSPLLDAPVYDLLRQYFLRLAADRAGMPLDDRDDPEAVRFNRHGIAGDPQLDLLLQALTPHAATLAGQPVRPTYAYGSLYGDQGVCPVHTDQAQCEYTLDLCIAQREPWDIFVDDVPYTLQENDALFFSGTDSAHYREPIQPGNHCYLAFFHFVGADSPVGRA